MKILALTVLGICCVMSGQYIAYKFNMRVTLLEKSIVMLNIIESNIGFLGLPAYEIIEILSSKDELKGLYFLPVCNKLLKQGAEFSSAWNHALKSNCFQPLKKEDIEILKAFSILFGKTDKDGQISNCRIHSALLNSKLQEARAECSRYASISSVFGVLSGVCVFIIFI